VTIAACYLSPEGVVFGSDSTTTVASSSSDEHYFDFGQKIFELGEAATLGIVSWGLGGIQHTSYRTLYAEFADDLSSNPPASVEEAAKRWAAKFYSVYDSAVGAAYRAAEAAAHTPEDKAAVEDNCDRIAVGFCLGGIALPNRRPGAFELEFRPDGTTIPEPIQLPMGLAVFRGVPMLINRMLYGIDLELFDKIVASPLWSGGGDKLAELVQPFLLGQPAMLPLRDAIDWIYACIYSTIKGLKFSPLPPICGGPVEVAVVTTDRPFRWVKHKNLDAAVVDVAGGTHQDAT
jgi:hypothetical protein